MLDTDVRGDARGEEKSVLLEADRAATSNPVATQGQLKPAALQSSHMICEESFEPISLFMLSCTDTHSHRTGRAIDTAAQHLMFCFQELYPSD